MNNENNSSVSIYPVQKGDHIELFISGMNHQGEGVGRYKGFAVFVPFAIPEDQVLVEIREVKSRYARGTVIEHLGTSDYRVQSRCPSYTECGGCHLQHYDYSQQLVLKEDLVRNALERIGKLEEVKVLPTIGMKSPFGYRNKAEYPVRLLGGVLKSGFFASYSNRLVALPQDCPLQHSLLEKTRQELMAICNQQEFQNTFTEAGLHHLVVRCGENTGEVMVILVVDKPLSLNDMSGFLSQLITSVPELVSIYQKVEKMNVGKRGRGRTVKYKLIEGKPFIRETIDGINFNISPGSFFQVNSTQAAVLFSKTVEYANCQGVAIDAYCGTGSISLFLANQAQRVYGIESFPQAVTDAKENAAINSIHNVEFILGDSGNILSKWDRDRPETVVLDPPRAGCNKKALKGIVSLAPEKIVYVSCNPATLARDLKFLGSRGYSVIEAQPIDMFPQTYHVETVVLITRVEK